DLLAAAGWKQVNNVLVDAQGSPLTVEFLIDAQVFERILQPWIDNLKAIRVQATLREVDPSQYAQRVNNVDFDAVLTPFGLPATPPSGFDQLYGSAAADQVGSYNQMGIKSKAVDAMIAKLPSVATRAQLVAILKSMDRLLRAGQYSVPSWYAADHKVAHW